MAKKQIIKFSKKHCTACDQLKSWLDNKEINYREINPFDEPDIAGKYKVRTVPTLLVLENDEIKLRLTGFNPIELVNHLSMLQL